MLSHLHGGAEEEPLVCVLLEFEVRLEGHAEGEPSVLPDRTLRNMGFIVGRQALMTPSKASRHVKREILAERTCQACWFCSVISEVTLIR